MSRKKKRKFNKVVGINEAYNNINTKKEYDEGKIKKTFHLKDLNQIYPKTRTQEDAFHSWNENNHLLMKGSAGTGKTFLALYLALIEVLDNTTPYEKVIIVRSIVPTRDIGHLPGTEAEKSAVYEAPYGGICDELFDFKKSYANLKNAGYVEFMSTSYIRGITLNNAIVVVDEGQNLNSDELSSIITRCGYNTRYIVCGDTPQSDHSKHKDRLALDRFQKIISRVNSFDTVKFTHDDIVRSPLVKEWIIAEELYSE